MKKLMTTSSLSLIAMAFGPAMAQMPNVADEGDWISLTGTVLSAEQDSFEIDYGTGEIEVEFDDLFTTVDADQELGVGENVIVYGYVDDDLFEGRVIDAEQVYVRERSTYYGENEVTDAQIFYVQPPANQIFEGEAVTLQGVVSDISGREFTLTSNGAEMSIDTVGMLYNPLDDEGVQQIQNGDRVVVTGEIDNNVFDEMEIAAEYITSLKSDGNQTGTNTANDRAQMTPTSENERQQTVSNSIAESSENAANQQEDVATSANGEMRTGDSGETSYALDGSEFAMIDDNDDGVVTRREYVTYATNVQNISRKDARRLFNAAARDNNQLTRNEFITPSDEVDRVFNEVLGDRRG